MLQHLLKLTWKRKNRNLMLSLEIMLAFVIVFAIAATAVRYWQLYQMPIGFQYQDVWAVQLMQPEDRHFKTAEGMYLRMQRAMEAMPPVRQAALTHFSPFESSSMRTTFTLPGSSRRVPSDWMEASDAFWSTMGMQLQAGRWPGEQDEGSAATAAVITRQMATALFGDQSPLDKEIVVEASDPKHAQRFRVVGVTGQYRGWGEFQSPRNVVISRPSMVSGERGLRTFLVRIAPGTPRNFEADLHRQLKQVRNDWGYRIVPLTEARASSIAEVLIPLKILAVVALFLLAMVGFGLFGVLWQNITRRIPEIGLRRAMGATAGSISGQIVAEQLLLSSVAMLAGLALLVQLPLTGALGESLNWQVFGGAAALSMGVIYLLSLLCALYPGWRASRLHPAAALHHE